MRDDADNAAEPARVEGELPSDRAETPRIDRTSNPPSDFAEDSNKSGGSGGSGSGPEPVKKKKDPRIGRVLSGRYRIEKLIAKGGMGRVYLSTQLQLQRNVAVKILNREFQEGDPQFARRFCLEAAICARVSHPNVVTVHDYGETESGELFMAMEHLRGQTLSSLIQTEAPLAPARLLHIALQIARALREAHAAGVIHRDLKPGNVMLISAGDDVDFVKVLDFGLVKLFVPEGQAIGIGDLDEGELTRAGTLLGSPRYMSPEQIRGETLDPRTDIYSFGIILFQMAAGKPPFIGTTSVDLIYKHIHESAPLVSSVVRDCPPEIERIIERCLQKKREARFESMTDLISALKQARMSITGVSDLAPPDTGRVSTSLAANAIASGLVETAVEAAKAPDNTADEATHSGALEAPPPAAPQREAAFQETPVTRSGRTTIVVVLFGMALAGVFLILVLTSRREPAVEPPPPIAAPPPVVEAPKPPAVVPEAVEPVEPAEESEDVEEKAAARERRKPSRKTPLRRTKAPEEIEDESPQKKPPGRYRDNPY